MGKVPDSVAAAARDAARRWNIPASVTIAQWALESAWGRAMPAKSNNPFGINAKPGEPFVWAATHEVVHGVRVPTQARFRAFDDLGHAFDAHGELLATAGAYAPARAVRGDAEAFAHALTGHYATDPAYGDKLVAIMRGSDLARFDAAKPG